MTARRPNVLLVTIDQWRADCLSTAGHPVVYQTSTLAARRAVHEDHFAQAAPCGPSRASLFTGLYVMNHRSVGNGTPLDARWPTLATLAREAGYDPVLFGHTDTTVDPRTIRGRRSTTAHLRRRAARLPHRRAAPGSAEAWLDWLRARGQPTPATVDELYAQAGAGHTGALPGRSAAKRPS